MLTFVTEALATDPPVIFTLSAFCEAIVPNEAEFELLIAALTNAVVATLVESSAVACVGATTSPVKEASSALKAPTIVVAPVSVLSPATDNVP